MSTYPFMTDDEREETVIERRDRERGESGKAENDEHIPLIPNIQKDQRKTVHKLQVFRTDPPHDGYKGAVPPHADYETISKLFGNGVYDFKAVTNEGKILRQEKNVKIDLEPTEPESEAIQATSKSAPETELLNWQSKQYEKDAARIENFGKMVVDQARETSKSTIESLTAQMVSTQERDRNFFSGILTQQQSFFANMMAANEQAHRHAMEQMRMDHTRQMALTQAASEQQQKANDPMLLLNVFSQALSFGQQLAMSQDDGEDDDESGGPNNPWVAAINAVGETIKSVADVKKAEILAPKTISLPAPSPALPSPDLSAFQSLAEQQLASSPNQPAQPQQTTKLAKPKRSPFSHEELNDLVKLRRLMEQKGLDFHITLRNAAKHIVGVDLGEPNQSAQTVPKPTEGTEGNQPELGPPDVENG